MDKKRSSLQEISSFAIGELIVAALTSVGFWLIDKTDVLQIDFDYRVILGALLGAVIIVANYSLLSLSVNRAVNSFIEMRGNREMSDEEANDFTKKNSAAIQNALKRSFMIRSASIVITLILAFLLDCFDPLATAIPMFAMRPVLTVIELINSKYNHKPDPSKFIKYEDEEDTNEGKEEN